MKHMKKTAAMMAVALATTLVTGFAGAIDLGNALGSGTKAAKGMDCRSIAARRAPRSTAGSASSSSSSSSRRCQSSVDATLTAPRPGAGVRTASRAP